VRNEGNLKLFIQQFAEEQIFQIPQVRENYMKKHINKLNKYVCGATGSDEPWAG
jgi:hypothetical protein